MILVFGGTTEGRIAVSTLDEGEGGYFYSTLSDAQEIECAHGTRISGSMSADSMLSFCKQHGIRIIVDAAHPFATRLHDTVAVTADRLAIPVIRLERLPADCESDHIIPCSDFNDAIGKMRHDGVTRLLALTGVNTISPLKPFWEKRETFFRILDREDSVKKALDAGFPTSRLIYYRPDDTPRLISELHPNAIITKESGASGGFAEKVQAAIQHNILIYVVRRPPLPKSFITVEGTHGLRRAIERLLPQFYPLHTGFTTGSCATAAAKAALIALLTGEKRTEITFRIPEGERMAMSVKSVETRDEDATATVIKDAGDDPDVTDKSEISARVAFARHEGIRFSGGEGIGIVTLPGLGLEVGEAAINPVPRRMITEELTALYAGGLDVTISLKGGAELAARTFNPRVGISGGVSIIGTSGIVRPFSHEAFVESLCREMNVAIAMGCRPIVVNSGAKSEKFLKKLFPALPPQGFIHYGNAIGEIMTISRDLGVESLVIGILIGKAVKLAEGHIDTHSHKTTFNRDFLLNVARECGCSQEASVAISGMNIARELWSILSPSDAEMFFQEILRRYHEQCARIYPGNLESILLSDDGSIFYSSRSYLSRESNKSTK